MEEIKSLKNDIEVYDMGIEDDIKAIQVLLDAIKQRQQWKKEAQESIKSLSE